MWSQQFRQPCCIICQSIMVDSRTSSKRMIGDEDHFDILNIIDS